MALDLNHHDHHDTINEEQVALDFLSDVATSVVRQAVDQGISAAFASSTVAHTAARHLCIAIGPDPASAYLRHLADLIDGVDRPRVYDA